MVDFKVLRKEKSKPKPCDPIEIFRRLPRASTINDLWSSQADALKEWYERKKERDIIIKLNTGGGKTLVGLLIAQSIANETGGSTLYLCPTNQLVNQTFDLSKKYGFKTTTYKKGVDLDDDFLTGKSIMIATYHALFNGRSKFGTAERGGECIPLEGIILDDAHTAFSIMRDQFTLSVDRNQEEALYLDLCNLFREDISKIGTFDDIIAGKDTSVLEVPYWSWHAKSSIAREKLKDKDYLVWPLLRNEFDYCHALIDNRYFTITPLYQQIDKFPIFFNAPRRIFMSATLGDDSSIIRTFHANIKSVKRPIVPKSLSGVGERMILIPASMKIPYEEAESIIKSLIESVSETSGVIILVPKNTFLEKWKSIAEVPERRGDVDIFINNLRNNLSKGPYAFANRYDGLDLPNNSCRLLVLDGKPVGQNSYDSFRLFTLGNSKLVNATTAQRIEQGLGRGTRGAGDYCVILLLGNDLIKWIGRTNNLNQLTPSTRVQLEMGISISEKVGSLEEFEETINKCLNRDQEWIEYYVECLAESIHLPELDLRSLEIAAAEIEYFDLIRKNLYYKAIKCLEQYIYGKELVDKYYQGWLFQLCARALYYQGDEEAAKELQAKALTRNTNLLKFPADSSFIPPMPGEQARNIVDKISEYRIRNGFLADFEDIVLKLTPYVTSNQFEESLKNLGSILGFNSARPENESRQGPDVLWIFNEKKGLIVEAKSQKKAENSLTKEEYGQILTHKSWFKSKYPSLLGICAVVHPNNYVSRSIIPPTDVHALTLDNLNLLIVNARKFYTEICESSILPEKLLPLCERKLDEYNLTPDGIINKYLVQWTIEK